MKYQVTVQRTRIELTIVDVEARDEEQAENRAISRACENPSKFDWNLEDEEYVMEEINQDEEDDDEEDEDE